MEENVYRFFKEISAIPRETYHIEKISNYLVDFAKDRNLEVYQDDSFNVMMRKEASPGYEKIEPVILQAHMDMVCQKIESSSHDFSKDGIEIVEENGFLRANGTTLGADDGIGMAMILALLDGDYSHSKLEVLFTVNEEVGMDGAYQVNMDWFSSNRFINLDSEEEGILTAGCAGGVQLEVIIPGIKEEKEGNIITIQLSGLLGGHSGVDIDKKRVNAITFLMNEVNFLNCNFISIDGGMVDNAILDHIILQFLSIEEIDVSLLKEKLENELKVLLEENATVQITSCKGKSLVFDNSTSKRIIQYFGNVPNGVISYEKDLKNKVCTSLNLGIVHTNDDSIVVRHLIRSSNENEKKSLLQRIIDLGNEVGADIREMNSFPGWEYQKDSCLRSYLMKEYQKMFDKELEIDVTHAGLECGILVHKKKGLDCVSIGPNVFDAHTSKEKVEIDSVNRMYAFLLRVLKNML